MCRQRGRNGFQRVGAGCYVGRVPRVRPVVLTGAEKRKLSRLASRDAGLRLRVQVVLLCAAGRSNVEIARWLHQPTVTPKRVSRWRLRFAARGLDSLAGRRGPRRARRLPALRVQQVLDLLARGVSTRRVASAVGVSQSTVARIRRGAWPHGRPRTLR
jgi:DNA-binding NarL/FixJ family response regulator